MTIYGGPDIITNGLVLHLDSVNTTVGQLFNGHVRGDNAQFKGYCSIYRIYNRYLEDNELSQNYNALKGRFGL